MNCIFTRFRFPCSTTERVSGDTPVEVLWSLNSGSSLLLTASGMKLMSDRLLYMQPNNRKTSRENDSWTYNWLIFAFSTQLQKGVNKSNPSNGSLRWYTYDLSTCSTGREYRVALGKHNLVETEDGAVFIGTANIIVHEKWSFLFIR